MLMPSLEQLQKRESRNYNIKVYIEDDNLEWVDFSSRVKRKKDLVLEIPNIKRDADSRFISSSFVSSASNLKVDNSDGFWEKPLDFTMKTEKGNTASFSKTKNESETVWCRRRIQFRIIEFFQDTMIENPVGTFLIDEIETDLSPEATLKLAGLEKPLMERDASVIKNGQTWYQNRSISFLVKKLLEIEYAKRNDGRLPDTFKILDRINLSTFDGEKTSSVIGPPPMEVDTDDDGISNLNLDNTKKARAICIAPSTISYANKDDDKDTLYLGCDEQLYSYNPNTDLFTQLTTISQIGSGYYIKHLWYSKNGVIFGVAYPDHNSTDASSWTNWLSVTAKVFKYEDGIFNVIKTITNFYDGSKYYRDGEYGATLFDGTSGTIIGQKESYTDGYAPNVYANYSQYCRSYKKGDSWNKAYPLDSADDDSTGDFSNIQTNGIDLDGNIVGYNSLFYNYTTGATRAGARLSFGQQGCVSFNDYTDSEGYDRGMILYCKVDNFPLPEVLDLYILDLDMLSEIQIDDDITMNIEGDDYRAYPISACARRKTLNYDYTDNYINTTYAGFFIGFVAFRHDLPTDGKWNYIKSEIKYYDLHNTSFSTVKTFAHTSSTDRGKIPIELYYNNPDEEKEIYSKESLYFVLLNHFFIQSSSSTSAYELKRATREFYYETSLLRVNNQPKGLVIREDTTIDLFFVFQQTGYINRYDATNYKLYTLDNGFPIVEDASFLNSNLIIDTVTRENDYILWGLASNTFDYEMTENASTSGSYLFKYDSVISEYIRLADFESMSIWNALGLLAQRANCIMGFDAKGDFFFQKREINDDDIEITDKEIINLKKERGMENVFNFVEITPFEVKFEQPEYNAFLKEREGSEETDTVSEEEIILKQLDSLTKELILICTNDGDANKGSTATSGFPLFKYRSYEVVINGLYTQTTYNSQTVYISSTFGGEETDFGIKAGYYLVHTDENEDEEYYLITAVDSTTNQITISGSVTVNKGDEFTVVRRNRLYDSIKDWSDEGVTFITTGTTSTEQTVNSLDALSINTYVLINNQYARITAIDTDTKTITLDSSITTATNGTVCAFFAPRDYSTFYEIGHTNVYLRIGSQNSRSLFKQGDRINISCKGFIIESDEKSKQIAINSLSTSLYGKKQYPNINNKFLTRKLAKQMADKIRTLYAFPKYVLTLTVPLYTFIDMINSTGEITTLKIRSKKLFPYREGFSETCYITSINHNFKSFMTQIECVAYNNY